MENAVAMRGYDTLIADRLSARLSAEDMERMSMGMAHTSPPLWKRGCLHFYFLAGGGGRAGGDGVRSYLILNYINIPPRKKFRIFQEFYP